MRLLVFLLLLLTGAAQAAWERTGQTASGAVYRLAVPEGWRAGDGLVIYQHDLSFERDLAPDLGPLLQRQLTQGYAVAASGYSQSGWALFASARDNRELVERFRSDVGEPGRILTYGRAMGAAVALQMAEDPTLTVDGALALCPVAAGDRAWDAALDLRVVYDAVCAEVDGGALPAGNDRPWLLAADRIDIDGLADVITSSGQCLGLDRPPDQRAADQRERLARVKAATGISSDDLLLLNLGYATLGLSDLVRAADKLAGGNAVGNAGVDYGAADLNATVQRIASDAFAALDFRLRAGLRGEGQARVVSVHTSRDERVPPQHQHWLRQRLPATRLTSALVAEDAPSHCGLTAAETEAAWASLHAWVEGAVQPDAVELQAQCLALVDAGQAGGPCRIDANLQPQTLDTAIRARAATVTALDARFAGHWLDPARPGEGWLIEVLTANTALVYGTTFPASGEPGEQLWLLGTGRIDGDGIAVDELSRLHGGAFGADFRAADAQLLPWGRLRFVFDACGRARLRVHGPAGYGRGERALVQAAHLGDQHCASTSVDAGGPGALSGSWYDPAQPGQGLSLHVRADGAARLTWFGYAPAGGEPIWLDAQGQVDGSGHARFDQVVRPHGARYERIDADAVQRQPWGAIELDFASCDAAVLRYRSSDPAYGSGELPLARLTRPLGLGDCGL